MIQKTCTKCLSIKPISDFSKHKTGKYIVGR
jgi:hypothetical protein